MRTMLSTGAALAALLPATLAAQVTPQPPADAARSVAAVDDATQRSAASPDDIVVTAQRRSERLQDVPMAVTALAGEALTRSPVTNLADIQTAVPNVNISPRNSSGVVSIRGIGFDIVTAGAEGSVAIHADGVYQSRPVAALAGLFDVDRIEVARGPQGTLYGRNATGGAINILSKRPTATTEGYVDVSYGNYDAISLEGALSGPIAGDVLTARVAAKLEQRDGWGTNLRNGSDVDNLRSRAVRGMLQFRPTDTIELLLLGDYFKRDDNAYAPHFVRCVAAVCNANAATRRGYVLPSDPRDVDQDVQPVNRPESSGLSLQGRFELPFADLSTITAYRSGSAYYLFDFDGTAQPGAFLTREENYRTFSQELQLGRKSASIDWLLGAFYFHERNDARANGAFPPFLAPNLSRYFQGGLLFTDAYAVFGEASYHLLPKLTLTIGGRYSHERKRIDNEFTFTNGPSNTVARQPSSTTAIPCVRCLGLPNEVSFDAFTPKFGIRYEIDDDRSLYATVQKGFKSGGFAAGTVTPAFAPEKIWSYEAGLKAQWFDRALTTNVAVYHYDYDNLQVGQVVGVATVINNAGAAKVDGIEVEFRAKLGNHVDVDGFGAYNHARFTSYVAANPAIDTTRLLDLSGNLLSNAPKRTGRLGAEYHLDAFGGSLAFRGDVFASSRVYFSPFNDRTNSQRGYSLVNASIRFDGTDDWYASAFINNVADRDVLAGSIVTSATTGAFVIGQYLPPRTYGLRLGKRF